MGQVESFCFEVLRSWTFETWRSLLASTQESANLDQCMFSLDFWWSGVGVSMAQRRQSDGWWGPWMARSYRHSLDNLHQRNARSINFLVLCFRFTGLFRSPEAYEWFTAIEVRQPDAARGFAWLALLSSIDAQSRWLWHPWRGAPWFLLQQMDSSLGSWRSSTTIFDCCTVQDASAFMERYKMDGSSTSQLERGLSPLMLASIEGNLSIMSRLARKIHSYSQLLPITSILWCGVGISISGELINAKANVDAQLHWRLQEAHIEGKIITALSLLCSHKGDQQNPTSLPTWDVCWYTVHVYAPSRTIPNES